MKFVKVVLTAVGALGFGASASSGASAQAFELASLQEEAEEACREALRMNTIEALEKYLHKYRDASTACRAMATEALGQFAPTNDDPPAGPSSGTGYSG